MNKALLSSDRQDWETPQDFFDELNREFHFCLDACANNNNAKCRYYFDEIDDALIQDWSGYNTIFMHPPYGRQIGKWIKKAYDESQKGCTVVCLVPSRTDTKWWHEYCMKGKIRFIKGRLYFSNAGRAPFPSAVVIFTPPLRW